MSTECGERYNICTDLLYRHISRFQTGCIDEQDITLASTYNELDQAAKELFKIEFRYYPFWNSMQKSDLQIDSYHKNSEIIKFKKQIGSYDIGLDEARRIYNDLMSRSQSYG